MGGNTELGVAYELPLTERQDIMKDRWTVDGIIRHQFMGLLLRGRSDSGGRSSGMV